MLLNFSFMIIKTISNLFFIVDSGHLMVHLSTSILNIPYIISATLSSILDDPLNYLPLISIKHTKVIKSRMAVMKIYSIYPKIQKETISTLNPKAIST